jgi:hypothetical protein
MLGYFTDQPIDPISIVDHEEALTEAVRKSVAGMFPSVGTCRIGTQSGEGAVVDPTCARPEQAAGHRLFDHADSPACQHRLSHDHAAAAVNGFSLRARIP